MHVGEYNLGYTGSNGLKSPKNGIVLCSRAQRRSKGSVGDREDNKR